MDRGKRAHRETQRKVPARAVGRRWALGALGAGAVALGGGWALWRSVGPAGAGNHPTLPPGTALPPTLAPALFVGKTAAAYRVAREIPATLAQLYCYCRCDRSVGHRSLLDCFTDDHGAG